MNDKNKKEFELDEITIKRLDLYNKSLKHLLMKYKAGEKS